MIFKLKLLFFVLFLFTGCVTSGMGPQGLIFTSTTLPGSSTTVGGSKIAESCSKSWFGLFAYGGDSVQEIASKANITTVSNVSYKSFSLFGVYSSLCAVIVGN